MTTIHFNTGRLYTRNGQRITATLHADGIVTFYDHDRMIDGEFALGDRTFCERTVLRTYDLHEHRNTRRSWEDGMLSTSPNAKYLGDVR